MGSSRVEKPCIRGLWWCFPHRNISVGEPWGLPLPASQSSERAALFALWTAFYAQHSPDPAVITFNWSRVTGPSDHYLLWLPITFTSSSPLPASTSCAHSVFCAGSSGFWALHTNCLRQPHRGGQGRGGICSLSSSWGGWCRRLCGGGDPSEAARLPLL